MEDIYVKLREKLETIGFGYPAAGGAIEGMGLEYALPQALFTPEEAELFVAMPNGYHTAAEMAEILGRPEDEVHEALDKMSLRGNLFRVRKPEGDEYRTVPVVHGLYEFSVPRAKADWVVPFIGYVLQGGMGERVYGTDVPLLRAIPAIDTIEEGTETMVIDDVVALINSKERIAVTDCLCRISMEMAQGTVCEHDKNTCMAFDEFADYYVENGFARYITKEEALEIERRGAKEGLIPQVGTSRRGEVLCNCCKCCCAVLACLKMFGGEGAKVASNYYAVNDPEKCTGCGVCVTRCNMDVISIDEDGKVSIDTEHCIGCGACVTTCATDAMVCRKKDDETFYIPPFETIFDGYSRQQTYRGFPA